MQLYIGKLLVVDLTFLSHQLIIMMIDNNSAQVDVSISCRSLKDMDFLTDKSDPYVRVSMSDTEKGHFGVIGITQTKYNDLNPNFDNSIRISYFFQQRQFIKFSVFDRDSKSGTSDDFLGEVITEVSCMMGADKQTLILDLKDESQKSAGKLITRCETCKQGAEFIKISLKAQKLANTDSYFDFWDKSDPYLKLIKKRKDGTKISIHTTQVVLNNLSPTWKQFEINLGQLVDGDKDYPFYIQCWDWEQQAEHQYIGQIQLTVRQLQEGFSKKQPFQLKSKKFASAGKLVCQKLHIYKRPTFLQFLRGGLKLKMMVCIDFTGSNGNPRDASSLHFINPAAPNLYQKALYSVTQILLNYAPDTFIPAYGFGAKIPGQYQVSHSFPLSLDPDTPCASGIDILMQMYTACLTSVSFSGPTYFGQILQTTISLASSLNEHDPYVYSTILILTDGEIHDMQKTIDIICQGAQLPISIVIVGIGNADFGKMQRLDGDDGMLFDSRGIKCPRDVVQFVSFKAVGDNKERLRSQVLAEIPKQVEEYYSYKQIAPKPAMKVDMSQFPISDRFKSAVLPMVKEEGITGYLPQQNHAPPPGMFAQLSQMHIGGTIGGISSGSAIQGMGDELNKKFDYPQ